MQIDPLFLTKTAYELRINVIDMLTEAQSGHTAGPLGMAEVFSVLYFSGLVNINPQNKTAPDRDRVILSNGHIAPHFKGIRVCKIYQKLRPHRGH